MQLSLERSGKTHATNMIVNPCKCAAMRTRVYHWYVKIDANDTRLTPEGYVLNNEYIGSYFEKRFGKLAEKWQAMSCERMALMAAKEIFTLLAKQETDCNRVTVRIKGSNGAWIEATCKPEDVKQ